MSMSISNHDQRRFGAHLIDAHNTRFTLWAPDAERVDLEILCDGRQPMRREQGGWFVLEVPFGAGTQYRFRIDDEISVPDPASRSQVVGLHGPSIVVDPGSYQWRHPHWRGRPWHETVIYELHAGLLGGFHGVEAQLAELAELGVTAIELMPIGEFPGTRNWGYDGVLPFAPESVYGSPDDLKHLIDTAHGHGLMVFLDVVYNHFGPEGNQLGRYAGAFFRHDEKTLWGDAIDFRQQPVRDFFIDNALMWLQEYRFDGLRLDAVHAISERDFLTELAQRVHAAIEPGRHVHLMLENEKNQTGLLGEGGYVAQWNDDGHNVLHTLLTGEQQGYYADYCQGAAEKLALCLNEGLIFQGQIARQGQPGPCGEPSAHLPPSAFILFLQNHDQVGNRAFGERLVSLANCDALRAATALLLLSPMVPLLFMGEEWGTHRPFLYFTGHQSEELAQAVREGRRREFCRFEPFRDMSLCERIPDPNDEKTFAASQPDFQCCLDPKHAEWRALYHHLLGLRRREIIPRLPGSRALGSEVLGAEAVVTRWLLGDGSVLRIELNLGAQAVPLPEHYKHGRLLFASQDMEEFHEHLGRLPARMARVYLVTPDEQR
ncbi:malto-oligosyltrehalose trehalohydrolase [Azotobacter vinelandii]|uniref:malto-oligosyltrehalose trehalohydrolase n=1 Tax=Azotobacter vinelandii TaxID=354 RepID=UPI00266558B6|nr:malto-oligosyltrehalose trehalohydrolase [Azotobacter vinelandii]WKN24333.1 malto-oligosyltrehalose trehalohydrolase [Azotobacter vinelandii]